jgi:uncharacterized membrane protein (DUF106 family)
MNRSRKSWKLLVLVALVSGFIFCSEVCADNCVKDAKAVQKEEMKALKAEQKEEMKEVKELQKEEMKEVKELQKEEMKEVKELQKEN